jgi:hypothetical protein
MDLLHPCPFFLDFVAGFFIQMVSFYSGTIRLNRRLSQIELISPIEPGLVNAIPVTASGDGSSSIRQHPLFRLRHSTQA